MTTSQGNGSNKVIADPANSKCDCNSNSEGVYLHPVDHNRLQEIRLDVTIPHVSMDSW